VYAVYNRRWHYKLIFSISVTQTGNKNAPVGTMRISLPALHGYAVQHLAKTD